MEFTVVGGFPKTQSKNHAQGKTQSPTLVHRHFWLQIRGISRHDPEQVGYSWFITPITWVYGRYIDN